MKGVEKSVFGSFFKICEYDSETFRSLNITNSYLNIRGKEKEVDVIRIVPIGTTKTGNSIFCYELLWR